MGTRFLRFAIIFLAFWIMISAFRPAEKNTEIETSGGIIFVEKDEISRGNLVKFFLKNPQSKIIFVNFSLQKFENGNWENFSEKYKQNLEVLPDEKKEISFSEENFALFGNTGKFRAIAKIGDKEFFSDFSVVEPGFFKKFWRALFFRPIENLLILFLKIPGGNLGVAIILLTILIKILLLAPNKKAIISQQKLQKLQPELEKIKQKYSNDPQVQAQKTMEIWKKHKVNPAGAIVPMLIQFPVMIALFFVIRDGLQPHNHFLIYPLEFLKDFDFSLINFYFLGINLAEKNQTFLPVIVGVLQFFQMQLLSKKAAAKKTKKDTKNKKNISPFENANKIMNYILPFLIAFFTASLPAAVGIYWGISTLFAIGQQYSLQFFKKN